MVWNDHKRLEGGHAFLSASKYAWLNYDDDKLRTVFINSQAAEFGTRLHAFASEAIKLGQKLPNTKNSLNQFVNDAVSYKMSSEVVLYYSQNCYGTADAISFRKNKLRIHDLKTGSSKASMDQLVIYAALFCLEYHVDPSSIGIELRIYQNNTDPVYMIPDSEEVLAVMDKIRHFDELINSIKKEGE